MKISIERKIFNVINYSILFIVAFTMLFPFLNIIAGSFSGGGAILANKVTIFPVDFTLDNYRGVFGNSGIWKAFGISIYVTVLGTVISLLFTSLMAYGLSRNELIGRSWILRLVVFTLIFQIPVIPSFLVIKELHLLNTLWSLIIPSAISAYNLIIMVSFFRNLEPEILEAAKIDGCREYMVFWKMVLPLSKASLSTIGLFYAVSLWNGYYNAIMYIRDTDKYTLQVKLRQLLVGADVEEMMQRASFSMQSMEGVRMATIIFSTLPILMVYPFIQRYFEKGSMIGSVKG